MLAEGGLQRALIGLGSRCSNCVGSKERRFGWQRDRFEKWFTCLPFAEDAENYLRSVPDSLPTSHH